LLWLLDGSLFPTRTGLEDLFGELRARVCGRARRFLGPGPGARGDASDVAQEVSLKLHQAFGQFQGQTVPELLAWARRTLGHQLIDDHRHHRAQIRDAGREVPGGDLFPGLAGDGTTPSRRAARNEEQELLMAALQRLPEKERLVVQLRLSGLPFEAVARQAGVTVGYARVLMVRATESLRKQLGGEE
jgi:RNA polymerase sigma factor (sigma-70 family)